MAAAAIPVLSLQAELAARCGAAFAAVYLDGSATSAVWLGPLTYAARHLGLPLADPMAVTDDDLAAFDTAWLDQLLDVAELRALKNVLGNYTDVDETVALGGQKLSQYRDALVVTIKAKEEAVKTLYGYGLAPVTAGTLDGGFASPAVWPLY